MGSVPESEEGQVFDLTRCNYGPKIGLAPAVREIVRRGKVSCAHASDSTLPIVFCRFLIEATNYVISPQAATSITPGLTSADLVRTQRIIWEAIDSLPSDLRKASIAHVNFALRNRPDHRRSLQAVGFTVTSPVHHKAAAAKATSPAVIPTPIPTGSAAAPVQPRSWRLRPA